MQHIEHYHQIKWQPSHNGVSVNTNMDIKVRPAPTKRVVLFIPGVDGSVDGYLNKYVNASDILTEKHKVGIVRISNQFISSFHWEENIRQALEFLHENATRYFSSEPLEISVVGHSAGAAVVASLAWEYPTIKQLLLINTPEKLHSEETLQGLAKFEGRVIAVYGENDPSVQFVKDIKDIKPSTSLHIISGADHHFTGSYISTFEQLPLLLFEPKYV